MKWWWQKELAPIAAAYREATTPRIAPATPLTALRFVALDSETTGLNIQHDRLLSLSLVTVCDGRVHLAGMANWLFYRENAVLSSATPVHGILPSDSSHGQPEPVILEELLPRLHGAIIVGHHIGFDAALLNLALRRHYGISLRNPLLDTGQLAMCSLDAFARTSYPGQRVPSLDEVCAQCDLPPLERHTAAGDAYTTALLFLMLCARLQRRLERPLRAGDLPIQRL